MAYRAWCRPSVGLAAAIVAICMLGISGGARAQTPTPLMYWQYSAGEVLSPYKKGEAPEWRVLLGPNPIYMPRYEGSDQYRVQPGVAFDVRYRERLFVGLGEGIGYDALRGRDYRVGLALGYDFGRSDHPGHINGMGDISPAPEPRLYGEYVFRPHLMGQDVPVILTGNVRKAIGGYNGIAGDLGLYMPVAGSAKKRIFVFAGPGVSFANDRTMNSLFSVHQWQSRRTGLKVYDADGGLRSAGFGVSAGWFITPHWLLTGQGAAERLLGDAPDSPVVEKPWQFVGGISVAYMWF
jgi:outer membrane scaffolding protein for murein synthesis (MipA/OmpV family)